jgi:hypothetical protein
MLMDGPPEPEVTVNRLRDLPPFHGASSRIAAYMAALTQGDYSNAVEISNKAMSSVISPVDAPFSRIRNLEGTVSIKAT